MKRVTIADFQRYGNIFSSIRENHILRQELSEYGYDDQEINKGRMLYDTASRMIEQNKTETTEERKPKSFLRNRRLYFLHSK